MRSDLLAQVQDHVVALLGEEDPEFVEDLIETFAASARGALAEAEAATSRLDAASLVAAAHTVKGSASNIGLAGLAGSWDAVETAARSGSVLTEAVGRAVAETHGAIALLAEAG